MKLSLLLLLTLPLVHSNEIRFRNLETEPLLVLEVNTCRIQKGVIKIIHPINVTALELTIYQLQTTLYKSVSKLSTLFNVIVLKIQHLYDALNQIKPRKKRSWDTIGTGIKWLAGNPDADDLRLINTTLNDLIDQHNIQFKINKGINNRLTELTQEMNTLILEARQSQADSADITALKLLMNANIIGSILTDLQDAILGAKISLPNSRILTTDELQFIRETMDHQGIHTNILDEILNYIEPKIAIKDDNILYILQIPHVASTTASTLEIIPLPVRNQSIAQHPNYLIQHETHLYVPRTPEANIQKMTDLTIFSDTCILPLLQGTNSTCLTTSQPDTLTKLVTDNKLLIINARNETLSSSCGPTNKTINGNVLLTVQNCTIFFRNTTYRMEDKISQIRDIPGLFYNTLIQTTELKQYSLHQIAEQTILQGKQLRHVSLKQFDHNISLITLFIGFIILAASITTCFVFYVVRQWQTRSITLTPPTFEDLLQRCNDRGRSSLPPGGVMKHPTASSADNMTRHVQSDILPMPPICTQPHELSQHNKLSSS